MRRRPKLLDLCCKAGGCSVGYHRAGFDVVGVDHEPQKRYPFEFVLADALEFARKYGHYFDVIAASPPCQPYTRLKGLVTRHYEDLLEPMRKTLLSAGRIYIIENLPEAPLINPIMLCGTMFPELRVVRHRCFETWPEPIYWPPAPCKHWGRCGGQGGVQTLEEFDFLSIAGNSYRADDGRRAMGIDWMTRDELSQAIPPPYTEWLGRWLIERFFRP